MATEWIDNIANLGLRVALSTQLAIPENIFMFTYIHTSGLLGADVANENER